MRPIQYVREFWLEYKALKRREIRHALRLHRQLLRAQLAVLVTQTKLARANIEIDLRLRTAADAASKAWRASHIRQIEETQRCMESSVARSAKDGEKEALSKAIGRMAGKIGAMASQPGGLGDIAKSSLGKIEDHKGIVPESIGALEDIFATRVLEIANKHDDPRKFIDEKIDSFQYSDENKARLRDLLYRKMAEREAVLSVLKETAAKFAQNDGSASPRPNAK